MPDHRENESPTHDRPNTRAAVAEERICRLICPMAAAMTGVCLTGIGLLHVVTSVNQHGSIADDLLSFDALLFLFATLSSYFVLRAGPRRRLRWLEQIADHSFIVAMVLLTGACFIITYTVT